LSDANAFAAVRFVPRRRLDLRVVDDWPVGVRTEKTRATAAGALAARARDDGRGGARDAVIPISIDVFVLLARVVALRVVLASLDDHG
jgi:hypothetical protein